MSGKYRKCLPAVISICIFLFFPAFVHSEDNSLGGQLSNWFSFLFNNQQNPVKVTAVKPNKTENTKEKIMINGFTPGILNGNVLLGLRAKAVADLYFRQADYSQALKYYEQASRHITNEADIYYNLGNIYAYEKVYNMAQSYYLIAASKYRLPENFGKTQKYYYLSMIRYGFSLEKTRQIDDNHKKALDVADSLNDKKNEMKQNYPEIFEEFDQFYRIVYGSVMIQNITNTNQ